MDKEKRKEKDLERDERGFRNMWGTYPRTPEHFLETVRRAVELQLDRKYVAGQEYSVLPADRTRQAARAETDSLKIARTAGQRQASPGSGRIRLRKKQNRLRLLLPAAASFVCAGIAAAAG